MKCSRCEKNEAMTKLKFSPFYNDNKLHAYLCEECMEEVIHFLYSCTCHIQNAGVAQR